MMGLGWMLDRVLTGKKGMWYTVGALPRRRPSVYWNQNLASREGRVSSENIG